MSRGRANQIINYQSSIQRVPPGAKNTSAVSPKFSEFLLAPTSCTTRPGAASIRRDPGTPEALVRGRFTALGQQPDGRRRRPDQRGDKASPMPPSCNPIMLLEKRVPRSS